MPRPSLAVLVSSLLIAACSNDEGKRVQNGDKIPCSNDSACATVFPHATACEAPSCNEGFCELDTLPDGTFCNDGQRCTEPDSCQAGVCGGVPIHCDDGNACTEDFCDPKEGCVYDALVAACDDGNPCTQGDVCSNKQCLPGQPVADCCVHDGECADGDPCTDDKCTDHHCELVPNEAPCNDNNPCTKLDRCAAGACTGELLTCEDGFSCTVDECDVATGLCVSTPAPDGTACDDRNECTSVDTCLDAFCIGSGDVCECKTDADCVPFEDADLCNGTLVCEAHECVVDPSTLITCVDSGDSCAPNACDPRTGQCVPSAAPEGTLCDDQNRCTLGDTCHQGICGGAPDGCDDGNACTFDQCVPDTGCVHTNHALPCSDGDPCTVGDLCTAGACVGQALDCDDDNPCTLDACQSGQCVHTPTTTSCDDGNACTSGEKCGGGVCGGGTVLCECQNDGDCASSEDGNLCNGTLECVNNKCQVDPATVVTCNTSGDTACKKTQCHTATGQCLPVNVANGTVCSDGSACTSPDTCTNGVCGGTTVDCNDQNPCTTDGCAPATGCTHANNTAACSDANACTSGDTCSGGSCRGTAVSCDDGNACTADSCNATTGCVHVNASDGTSCGDANLCNGSEECRSGVCNPGTAPVCDDGNVCTSDSCAPATGCVHGNVANGTSCADADVCDGSESCFGGICTNGTAMVCNDGNACTTDECNPSTGCVYTPIVCGAPNITCGADITTTPLPDAPVTISGSAFDPDGGTITYQWVVTSAPNGSTAQPGNPTSATTSFLPDLAGVYVLTLTATDDEGLTASCQLYVTALAVEALRIELVWDTAWGDVDLHLIRPGVVVANSWFSSGEDDCWYGNPSAAWPPNGGAGNASLDVDDTDGYGPENINIDTSPASGDYTIGVEFYCSHSLAARGGGPPQPVNPGDGPATGLVRVHCGGQVIEIGNLNLDESGRFIIVGTVSLPSCAVTTIKSNLWVSDVQPSLTYAARCDTQCTRDSDCQPGEKCDTVGGRCYVP